MESRLVSRIAAVLTTAMLLLRCGDTDFSGADAHRSVDSGGPGDDQDQGAAGDQVDAASAHRRSDDDESDAVTDLDGKTETLRFDPFDVERAEIEAFAAAIAGTAAYPVTRAEIVNGVAAFEGVSRSAGTNQWVRLG